MRCRFCAKPFPDGVGGTGCDCPESMFWVEAILDYVRTWR